MDESPSRNKVAFVEVLTMEESRLFLLQSALRPVPVEVHTRRSFDSEQCCRSCLQSFGKLVVDCSTWPGQVSCQTSSQEEFRQGVSKCSFQMCCACLVSSGADSRRHSGHFYSCRSCPTETERATMDSIDVSTNYYSLGCHAVGPFFIPGEV